MQTKGSTSSTQKWPNFFLWKSFEEKDELTLPFTSQEAIIYYKKKHTPRDKVSMIMLFQTFSFLMLLQKGKYGPIYMKDLASHKAKDIHGLKPKLLKWVANNLCEPITQPFNLVVKEGLLASWIINIISSNLVKDYRAIMLGTIFGKF